MIRVYLAGKIREIDWRATIFPELWRCGIGRNLEGQIEVRGIPPTRGQCVYNGPYFMRCGHGCYFGDSHHGVAANRSPEFPPCEGRIVSRAEVAALCEQWIRSSDAVFAWINEATAYGTLVELGFARAAGIPIFLCYANERFAAEMWLAGAMANWTHLSEDPADAFDLFSERYWRQFHLQRLKSMPYAQYLQTPHWKDVRARKLAEVGRRCQLCNSERHISVHHRTYVRRGEELLSDLTVLCGSCHSRFHGRLAA